MAKDDQELDEVVEELLRVIRDPAEEELEPKLFVKMVLAEVAAGTLSQFYELAADAYWLLLAALEDSDDSARRVAFKAVMDRFSLTAETLEAARLRTAAWYYGVPYQQRLPDLSVATVAMDSAPPIARRGPVELRGIADEEKRFTFREIAKAMMVEVPPYAGPVYFFSAESTCGVAHLQPRRADGKQEIWPCILTREPEHALHQFVRPVSPQVLGEIDMQGTKAGTLLLSVDAEGFVHVNPLHEDVGAVTVTIA